jgi:hypothetical protein
MAADLPSKQRSEQVQAWTRASAPSRLLTPSHGGANLALSITTWPWPLKALSVFKLAGYAVLVEGQQPSVAFQVAGDMNSSTLGKAIARATGDTRRHKITPTERGSSRSFGLTKGRDQSFSPKGTEGKGTSMAPFDRAERAPRSRFQPPPLR